VTPKRLVDCDVVLIGAPGSGKSTVGRALAERVGVPYIATGDLLRELGPSDPAFDRTQERIGRGQHAEDVVVLAILRNRLARDPVSAAVLDGFPRTPVQLGAYREDAHFRARGRSALFVELACAPAVCLQRLTRRAASESRCDDTPTVQEQRVCGHPAMIAPLLAALHGDPRLVRVNGECAVDEVLEEVLGAIAASSVAPTRRA
jgi:adenylate kinase